MTQNELLHYGKLGMKWGVRRAARNAKPEDMAMVVYKPKKKISDDDIIRVKSNLESGVKLTGKARELNTALSKTQASKKKEADLAELSDADLKAKVARLNLETQYRKLAADDVSKGSISVEQTLNIAGGVLAVGATALTIALQIRKLKEGGS